MCAPKSLLSFVFGTICLTNFVSLETDINVTIAVLAERSAVFDFPFSINRTSGLIDIAIDKSRDMLSDVANLNFVVVPCDVPTCIALKWGALFAEVYHKYKPHAVIGPGCSPSVQTVSRMAVSWNIPHITYVGMDEFLGNKREYSVLTRLSFTLNLFAKFYVEVFNKFSWTYVTNIYDTSEYLTNLIGTSLQRSFEEEASNIRSYPLPFNAKADNLESELWRTLLEAASKSRVFIVACHGDVLRQLVLLARRSDLLEEGKYSFIFYFQFLGDPPIGEYDWKRGEDKDDEAKIAYESVMVVRPRHPITEEFLKFERDVKERARLEYNYTWKDDHEVSIYNIGHYDAFVLYAHALNDTIRANEDPRDGLKVTQRMWNRTFLGIGGQVYINSNGDRDTDFTLLDLNPISGEFQMVMSLKASTEENEMMRANVVAQYLGWTNTFEFIRNVPIHWPRNAGPPPNVPACGFTGELCVSFSLPLYAVVAISLSCVIILVVIVGLFAYRQVKAEAAIHSEWWRVRSEDISRQALSSFLSQGSQEHSTDDDSLSLATHAACLQFVGMYRGTQVYVRKPNIKSLTIDRSLLLELKQMHDITCQNLTRLIGVCPETNNVSILTEYCSRGNLQDFLQNESIQLDWPFKISLINDIVEGMNYLHNSPVAVHGRLTSSRCVIDSRFVVKITGFGLQSVNTIHSKEEQRFDVYTHMPELLWMSPEHLRVYPPRKCSQTGDVYSFGIILYEMITRNEPYVAEVWYRTLDDTIEKIKKVGREPVRPSLLEDGLHDELIHLATCCWHEIPTERPNFINVKKVLKQIHVKRGSPKAQNVLDVLLNRMEQYANNLEGLVAERTQQFLQEKKKSEELLHQVLPKSVAEQLQCGKTVHPESFDSVTIYFSDIVGFTKIAAKSSPFQIVDFLNDLYTCFDLILEHFDVYKVETIGDAYMVVSGLPEKNGIQHACQIARMSLQILDSVRNFTIRHQPVTPLKARIGLHSGPVCAGVVGRKMPRYCLFGDTVNTASRMESNGEAMSIHISQDTKKLLEEFGKFVIEERGEISIKGKGTMTTYWLIDEIAGMCPSQIFKRGSVPEVSC